MLFSSHRILLDNKQFCFVPLLMVTWLRMCLSRLSAIQFFYFGQLIFCGEVLWEFACISLVIKLSIYTFIVLCCCSAAQPCLTICDPTECSTPSFPSPSPGAGSNSCPLSRWYRLTISSSVAFNLSQHQGLFQWGSSLHQVAKILELQHQSFQWIWIPLGLTGLISLLSKGLSTVFSRTTIQKLQFFGAQPWSNSHMTTGKTIYLTRQTFVGKVMSLLFNTPSRFVIAFLPRSKRLLILWL